MEITIFCPMNFESYPFDTSICHLTLGSPAQFQYSLQNFTITHFNFNASRQVTNVDYDIQVNPLPEHLRKATYGYKNISWFLQKTGVEIVLQRKTFDYLVHYYMPSFAMLTLSWVIFFFKLLFSA